jgi:hypothetical protein
MEIYERKSIFKIHAAFNIAYRKANYNPGMYMFLVLAEEIRTLEEFTEVNK